MAIAEEYSDGPTRAQLWQRRGILAFVLLAIVGLITWGGLSLTRGTIEPAHQVAKIALLPDTPPPPPPPPPPDKPKVEPKEEMKQQPDRPKQETLPEPAPLKMAGPAGDGPSPFQAGEVRNDYIGGDIGNGSAFSAYVGRVAQLIQDELARRKIRVNGARIFLWLKPDGSVDHYEVRNASADVEKDLRTAVDGIGRLPDAPPADMPMPMGLDITEH